MKSFYSATKFTTAQNLPKSFHDAFICSWVLIAYLATFHFPLSMSLLTKNTVSQININASFNNEKLGKLCIIFIKSLEKRKDRNVNEVSGYRS